jgi:pimeloyl-ACP methyl ester carboxylesterase
MRVKNGDSGVLGDMGISYDSSTGLEVGLYPYGEDGQYYAAFRSSDNAWNNWRNNFGQGLGMRTAQYDQAVILGSQIWKATNGNVIFVGHSLGGGLASAAAYATGMRAITFNAAGLGSQYRIGTPGEIRAHYIRGDILTTFQRWTPFPNAAGMPIPHPGQRNPFSRHAIGQFP